MKIGDLIQWILTHRRGGAFKDWSEKRIAETVIFAVDTGGLIYATDDNGFTGVAIIVKDNETKTAETGPLLTINRQALIQMSKFFYDNYPDWKLLIHSRKGGFIKYDDRKFLKRLFMRKM